jgi:hypothetical protein
MTGKKATMIIIDDPYRPEEPDPKKLDEWFKIVSKRMEELKNDRPDHFKQQYLCEFVL